MPETDRYRWIIVAAGALLLAVAVASMANGLSAFIVPLEEARGWSRAAVSSINSVGILGMALGGIVFGPIADRFGARPVVLFGVTALGIAYIAASRANEVWQLQAIFFAAGFFGSGAVSVPVLAIVGSWFSKGAGLAIGLISAGQAAGQGTVPFVWAAMIERIGPDATFAWSGVAVLAILIPAALLLKPAPVESASGPSATGDGYMDIRLVVGILSLAGLMCCITMSTPLMHLVPLIQDQTGVGVADASSILFGMMLIAIIGRASFGKLADMIGPLPAYMTAVAWMTLLVFGFTLIETLGTYRWYALVYGFGYAGVMTGLLVSTGALARPDRRAFAFGMVTAAGWLGHAVGGFQGGALHDLTGSYDAAYAVAVATGLLNLVIVYRLWRMTKGPKVGRLATA